ncbi:hypothetical protein B0H19DRAFT_1097560 [Mycena capillaripes]|nr:hypothetical protein B0H19DRAFT_1097560 [Mycena capillaripes]
MCTTFLGVTSDRRGGTFMVFLSCIMAVQSHGHWVTQSSAATMSQRTFKPMPRLSSEDAADGTSVLCTCPCTWRERSELDDSRNCRQQAWAAMR